jgi:bacillithiol system protein YtxJ
MSDVANTGALEDGTPRLTTPAAVDAFLAAHRRAAVFKAGLCRKNTMALRHVRDQLVSRDDVALAIIHVVECRAASDHVAALTGITHESPQLILCKDGRAVFERDNWDITAEAVRAALAEHFAPARA